MNIKYINAIRNINNNDFHHRIIELYKLAKEFPKSAFNYYDRAHEILSTLYFLEHIDIDTYNALCEYYRPWFFRLWDIYANIL